MEAIFIMWQRQVKTFVRVKHRLFGSLAQPVLFMVAFGFGFGPTVEKAGNGSYIQYLIPGIIGMTILFGSVMNGMSLIWDKQFGFLKETLVAPVPRINLLMGRCLGGATTSFLQGVIVFIIGLFIGFKVHNWPLLIPTAIVMFTTSLMFTLFGTAIASKVGDMQAFPTIMNLLLMPMFFLSGALFPLENLPGVIKSITIINPMTYCVDLLRYFLVNQFNFGLFTDLGIVIVLLAVFSIAGVSLFNRMET